MNQSKTLDSHCNFSSELCTKTDESSSSIRNNWSKTYQRIYHELGLAPLPSTETLAISLAKILENMVESNSIREVPRSPYNAKKVPGISLKDYFGRLAKYSRCSFETLVLAIIYIDRLHIQRTDQFLHKLNMHK